MVGQPNFLEALAKVKARIGREVHFIYTSGAKMFSSWTGAPCTEPLLDTDEKLFEVQKEQQAQKGDHINSILHTGVTTNIEIIELAEKLGVRSYIFIPCIVYGKSRGFGNPISIQTVALIKAAKALGKLYKMEEEPTSWSVSHVDDTTNLYLALLKSILNGANPGYGKSGYYLAASGNVKWEDMHAAFAKALNKRGVTETEEVAVGDEAIFEKIAQALNCPKWHVPSEFGGQCTLTAKRGEQLGWKSQFAPKHILETVDDEVELVLNQV